MKRIVLSLVLALILTMAVTTASFAGGDQVRGENGQGSVNQNQVMDPPPFP